MQTLDPEENLIATVARATCFTYRLDVDEVPTSDVELYVNELVSLFHRKPDALLTESSGEAASVADTVRFCAEQLKDVAPGHAATLRSLLEKDH